MVKTLEMIARLVLNIARIAAPGIIGFLTWRKYGISPAIAAGHMTFIGVALQAGWPRLSWLSGDIVQSVVTSRGPRIVRLTHACARLPKSPVGSLEQWQYEAQELANLSEVRDFEAASFQLTEARAAIDEVRTRLLQSIFIGAVTTLIAIGLAAIASSSQVSQSSSDPVHNDITLILSILTGIAAPLAQIMFMFGCCVFVYKRNLAYR